MKNILLLHQILDYTSKKFPNEDSCWTDRIFNWEYFYHISQLFDFSLVVQSYYWPEFLFLDVPNTTVIDFSDLTLKHYDQLDMNLLFEIVNDGIQSHQKEKLFLDQLAVNNEKFSKRKKLPYHQLRSFLKNKESLFETTNFKYCMYDAPKIRSNSSYWDCTKFFKGPPSIFKEIKFKDDNVNNFFINNFSDVLSIQIRRGIGTIPNEEYISDLKKYVDSEEIKEYYERAYKLNSTPMYNIALDSSYFELIDSIIKETPNQKIYLSYDVPKKFINHFLEKYPNNIVTKENYLKEYLNYFNEYDIKDNKKYFLSLGNVLITLLDFFAMAYSGSIVSNYSEKESGWIYFSLYYRDKKILYI